MQNSLLEQLCQEHQEPIVAVAFNDQNTISQGLCLKCWPQSYNKKVLLVEDVLDITKNIKEEYQQLDVDTRKNMKTLYQLMQELEKLKVFMKQSINESIKTVNDWIKNISEQDQCARSSIQILNFDLNTSLQNAQQQVQELQKQKEKCLQFIQQQLKILKDNDHFNNCTKLLAIINEEKFDPPQNQNVLQQLDKSIITQNNLICQQHDTEIIMVDLNQKPKIQKRLACVYCIQNYPTQYTAIKIAQKLYRKQETQKIQNLNKYSESIDQIKQSFNSIKIAYRNVIKDVTSSLSQNNKEIKQKAETYLNNLNIDWQALKNDEVTELAEKLCQNEQEDIVKSQIYIDFIKINQEINKKINDAFNKMKSTQHTGKNQIKQLMIIDYFSQNDIQTDINCQHNSRKETLNKTPKTLQIKDNNNNKLKNQLEIIPLNNDQKEDSKIKRKNKEQYSNRTNQEKIQNKVQKQSEIEKQFDEIFNNQSQTIIEKKFQYILNKISIIQEEPCRSFSFNSDSSLLIAACEKSIKLFVFNKESLILQQTFSDHPSLIVYCTFLKNQNRFISGCLDGSMLIWSNCQENKQEWQCEQRLAGHTDYLGHIIYSKIENMIISCSNDKTIKFWKKSQIWELHQTLKGHNQYVCSISLNESENKLISGAYDDQILVSEPQGKDKQWTIIQVIKVDWGRRLCFITDNLFTFQPCKKDVMHIYEQKESKKGFYKSKEIAVKSLGQNCLWLFPQQFSKKQGLLVNKNCHTINIIRWKGKNKFVTDQAINFDTNEIYGSITDDGDWLITWDDKSKEIQIRGLK
ncbi:unnamed protein product [Paramecium primaurelia]|uniref:WD40-repeat-containing domain n=1 Tax=Paramecium primaurelia TaxID=5886 RepID=A0A8S1NEH4_PARPR|nr:unnamed protein product [Paramecium primaurelia]